MANLVSTNALADDPIGGLLTVTDGIVHYLTRCCGASAKGSANSSTLVVCRNCYQPIDPALGGAWNVADAEAWQRYQARLGAHIGDAAAARLTDTVRVRALDRGHGG
ncbi:MULTISPECIES: hypothetical protein [Mycobacterium avium complex (MAC)]|uniref:Uncharacterized protein n=1 Tax=Mycobacterium intracellulare subsp. chimaera TaxID=222805 RepID=A0ABT7P3H5_MYCIT|nr:MULTISPECIES: hypothetical protein [Mycobacterium avium complex (MAC)]AOS94758.1 hypothetical protein AN480_27055 [Mycobacterium intracellulare subsp. chimaera]MDM3927831.1 hypothetical protein [Mycobacterium intracellulare subsp. chimaera]PBA69138.1 hypothetical protein CKJ76_24245 [Mycobacterium avium]